MVNKIYELKNQILEHFEKEVQERGIDRLDVTEAGKLADIVKDLAEAEAACWEASYYRAVTEAMGQKQPMGYQQPASGMRQGYQASGGYGHTDAATETLRNAMMTASPDERERIRGEAMSILGMR